MKTPIKQVIQHRHVGGDPRPDGLFGMLIVPVPSLMALGRNHSGSYETSRKT